MKILRIKSTLKTKVVEKGLWEVDCDLLCGSPCCCWEQELLDSRAGDNAAVPGLVDWKGDHAVGPGCAQTGQEHGGCDCGEAFENSGA